MTTILAERAMIVRILIAEGHISDRSYRTSSNPLFGWGKVVIVVIRMFHGQVSRYRGRG